MEVGRAAPPRGRSMTPIPILFLKKLKMNKLKIWAGLALPTFLAAQHVQPTNSPDTLDLREVVISSARWKQTA